MNLDFLKQENWPKLGQGSHSNATKDIHLWCGQISSVVLELFNRVTALETEKISDKECIEKLKLDIKKAANSSKSICEWSQIVSQGQKTKKPTEQLVATNVTINELEERKKRAKNIIIYGVVESAKETIEMKLKEDESKVSEIFNFIGKENVKPKFIRRLRSKSDKPGPILIELSEESERNSLLISAKKLRSDEQQKNIYISPDLTEAQRLQDFKLRSERNELNAARNENDPFWFGIRGNQIIKFKKKSN